MIDLKRLRYFLVVAQERNFTRAAEVLGVSQPPLSRQIRELEEEIGEALFDRAARPVRLTEAGRVLYDQAEQVMNAAERLNRTMRDFSRGQRRRFVVGFVGSIVYGPAPRAIRAFREAAPQLDVDLVELTTLEQITALKEGRIDVGLGRVRLEDSAVSREVLYEEPLVAALAADDPLAECPRPLPLAALVERTLILYPSRPRPSYADQVIDIFRDRGLQLGAIKEVREVQTALGLAAARTGTAIVPESLRHFQRDDLAYLPLDSAHATSPIILSRRRGEDAPEIERFAGLVREVYDTVRDRAGR